MESALPKGAKRLVVGHCVQRGGDITSACGGKVLRVDVGISKGVSGSAPQVLEITRQHGLRVLRRKCGSD